jgi:hypothetical protein
MASATLTVCATMSLKSLSTCVMCKCRRVATGVRAALLRPTPAPTPNLGTSWRRAQNTRTAICTFASRAHRERSKLLPFEHCLTFSYGDMAKHSMVEECEARTSALVSMDRGMNHQLRVPRWIGGQESEKSVLCEKYL